MSTSSNGLPSESATSASVIPAHGAVPNKVASGPLRSITRSRRNSLRSSRRCVRTESKSLGGMAQSGKTIPIPVKLAA